MALRFPRLWSSLGRDQRCRLARLAFRPHVEVLDQKQLLSFGPGDLLYFGFYQVPSASPGRVYLNAITPVTGIIQSIAPFSQPYGIAIDKSNNVFVGDYKNGVWRVSPSGQKTFVGGGFAFDSEIAAWIDGNL